MRPMLIFFAVIFFFYAFEYSQWGFSLPLHLGKIYEGLGAKYYGYLAGINGFVVIVCTPIITNITHKIAPIRVMAIGGLFYALAFGMFSIANTFAIFATLIVIMTLGEIMISINSSTLVANHTPASHRGRVGAVLPLISGAGFAMAPSIMGEVATRSGFFTLWVIIGIMGLASSIMMFALEIYERKKGIVVEEEQSI